MTEMAIVWFICFGILLFMDSTVNATYTLNIQSINIAPENNTLEVEVTHSTPGSGTVTDGEKMHYIEYVCRDHDQRVYYLNRKRPEVKKNTFGPIRNGKEYVVEVRLVLGNGTIAASVNQTYYLASREVSNFTIYPDEPTNQLVVNVRTLPYSLYEDYEVRCRDLIKNKTRTMVFTATIDALLQYDVNNTNLALGKPSYLSRSFGESKPEQVNNGNPRDIVSSTASNSGHWWMVDLENSYQIGRIDVFTDPTCRTIDGRKKCGTEISHLILLTAIQRVGDPDPSSDRWFTKQRFLNLDGVANVLSIHDLVVAKFVALYSSDALVLAEVQIFERGKYMRNIALRKATRQSSNSSVEHLSDSAVNGIMHGAYDFSATNDEAYSWWLVDLGAMHDVESMEIYRNDSATESAIDEIGWENEFYIQNSNQASVTPCTEQDRQNYQENYYANNFVYPVTRVLFVPLVTTRVLAVCSLLNDSLELAEVKIFEYSSERIERRIPRNHSILYSGGLFECVLSSLEDSNSTANSSSFTLFVGGVHPRVANTVIVSPKDDAAYVQVSFKKRNQTEYYTDLGIHVKTSTNMSLNMEEARLDNSGVARINSLTFGMWYHIAITAVTRYGRDEYSNVQTNDRIYVAPLPPKEMRLSFNPKELSATITLVHHPSSYSYFKYVYLNMSSSSEVVKLEKSKTSHVWKNLERGVSYTFEAWTQSDMVDKLSQKIRVEEVFEVHKKVLGGRLKTSLSYGFGSLGLLAGVALVWFVYRRVKAPQVLEKTDIMGEGKGKIINDDAIKVAGKAGVEEKSYKVVKDHPKVVEKTDNVVEERVKVVEERSKVVEKNDQVVEKNVLEEGDA